MTKKSTWRKNMSKIKRRKKGKGMNETKKGGVGGWKKQDYFFPTSTFPTAKFAVFDHWMS
jgi:hypothetical protein